VTLELVADEEADRAAIGRPEGEQRAVGAGQRSGGPGGEIAKPELPFFALGLGDEHDHITVGRNHRRARKITGKDELRVGRRRDLQPDDGCFRVRAGVQTLNRRHHERGYRDQRHQPAGDTEPAKML
jgi:hypothetical protein